ncbi:MAG: rhodanese-like domain-containing protein [Chitinophagaceae bacterium]
MFEELEELIVDKENTILVDVRTLEEFNHIQAQNTVNIDSRLIEKKISFFRENNTKNFVIFCRSGVRSLQVVQYLSERGVAHVYNAGTVDYIIAVQQKK